MYSIHEVLKQYWGYPSFRPLQEEIIQAVLEGKDVLALLPTGGGKSLCFQVPTLLKEGVCIVVSPLIALMKDQVEQLKKRGIAAVAIFAGMTHQEIDVMLDNCIYGKVKFLYVSPERLKTTLFQERVKRMKVSLLVVDEAHCISQWGYDFRPPYLEIAALRPLIPTANTMALTATATKEVKADIQEKLHLNKVALFQKSFARDNLAYAVRKVEDKEKKLLAIIKQVPGSTIVYANTRKKTQKVANFLKKNGISSAFYHAGLPHLARTVRQDAWMEDKIRVMVATNAFGMGIDKPDVRLVVHLDLPTTLEAYYQEAGRAGRDEKKAYAVVLYDEHDIEGLRERIQKGYPSIEQLKKVYQQLANYYKIAVGSHTMVTYDFDLEAFSLAYQLKPFDAYQAMKQLEEEGLIQLNKSFFQPSKIVIAATPKELYAFQVAHASYDTLIKALLRMYGGELFTDFCRISEKQIAKFLTIPQEHVVKQLNALARLSMIRYIPQKEQAQLTFITPRYPAHELPLNTKKLKQRKAIALNKAETIIHYVTHAHRCRTQLLLAYLDEVSYKKCHICDICLEKGKKRGNGKEKEAVYQQYRTRVLQCIEKGVNEIEGIIQAIAPDAEETLLMTIRQLLENEEITYDRSSKLILWRE